MPSHARTTRREPSDSPLLQRRPSLRTGARDDRYEREADRAADTVIRGGRLPLLSTISVAPPIQRESHGKPKTEEEKYKEAAKKLGEAFLETKPGREIKEKAEQLGDAFISTLPGKIITGTAITGAIAGLAAAHKELPIDIPEIPLDKIRPGLKMKITYEGPVDRPTKVMIGFSFPLGVPESSGRQPEMSKAERSRAETARMARELAAFRESLKTPEQRAEEQRMIHAWVMSNLRLPASLRKPEGPGSLPGPRRLKSAFRITGEQPKKEEPRKKKKEEGTLQRKGKGDSQVSGVPAIVNDVLRSSGQPMDRATRRLMESRFGRDFSRVRIHSDSRAARSAQALQSQAYTVGNHVAFATGSYEPRTRAGRHLLAHELAHVVQQTATTSDHDNMLQRKGGTVGGFFSNLGRSIASIFGDELKYDEDELQRYLTILDESNDIEDDFDSDDKARAIVRSWVKGSSPYVLTPRRIILLIKEMQSGFTGNDDERCILDLLEHCENHDLNRIFSPAGIDAQSLIDDFHFDEFEQLKNFFERRFVGGMSAVLQGKVKARGKALPLGSPIRRRPQGARESHPGDRIVEAGCSVRAPGNCHSYEQWLQLFSQLPTFRARSGHRVIGPRAAPVRTATSAEAPSAVRRPALLHSRRRYLPTDRFIDGPTDLWVRDHLPPQLLKTAYQLPSDCADVAVILRHVWLVSHGRTEVYRGWLCGARLIEQSRSKQMLRIIRGRHSVGSWNVAAIIRPYTGSNGRPIRSFRTLSGILHAGDVLVWEHQDKKGKRLGGHTQTIIGIRRSKGGNISELVVLQGNQPISKSRAERIRAEAIEEARQRARQRARARGASRREIRKAERIAARRAGRAIPSVTKMRFAPGRRLETSSIGGSHLRDNSEGIWSFPTSRGHDILIAAGPPASSVQPAVRKRRSGDDVVRGLVDWLPDIRRAPDTVYLQSIFEAALLETRSLIEGGKIHITDVQAAASLGKEFATTAGERLWVLAKRSATRAIRRSSPHHKKRISDRDLLAGELAEESHYRPLRHMSGMLKQIGADSYAEDTRRLFDYINPIFSRAARGTTSIDFSRPHVRGGTEMANVLLTGFDPFMFKRTSGKQVASPESLYRQAEPEAGRWNPSGAAILQLDGKTIPAGQNSAASVEGMIFPVDYRQFRAGLVESALRSAGNRLDAAITLSMDPNIAASEEPVIERYAVGVHRLNNGRLEPIPAAPGSSSGPGPAIIEARGGLGTISQKSGLPQATRSIGGENIEASIRSGIRFRFINAKIANSALRALGLPAQDKPEVVISDPAAISTIIKTMSRGVQDIGITFHAGGQYFQAWVLSGPGGRFLSNEVSYRVLRALTQSPKGRLSTSFHIHTPRGEAIPQAVATREQRRHRYELIQAGRALVRRLVERLKLIIKAVAERIVSARRRQRGSREDSE